LVSIFAESTIVSCLVVCGLLYMLNKKHAHVTLRRCFCLSVYPFVAQLVAKYFSQSEPELMGVLACFATLFCVVVFPNNLPCPMQ
jgi:F0F1-type ATP synthase membrane subunit a